MIAHPPGAASLVLWHNGGTSGFPSFRGRRSGDRHRRGRAQQHRRSVDRLGLRLLKALPDSAG
jgi:hypothetical protein